MIRIVPARGAGIERAAEIMRAGGIVAFPTETVYGLGADATQPKAVARVFEAKGRPSFNPLIAHVEDIEAAMREALLSPQARRLAEAFWPAPLTLVAPIAPGATVCELARAGLQSVAVRVPAHPAALALIRAVGRPIAAPSANISGRVSPVTALHVVDDLNGKIELVLEGGRAAAGLESTIVSFCSPAPVLLRPGAISRADIEQALGDFLRSPLSADVLAPGMTQAHYAPKATLRLDALEAEEGEAVLDYNGRLARFSPPGALMLDLSPSGDPTEAAANLFSHLRELDRRGAKNIAVAPIPPRGLGEAINDRLRRAATPRRS